MPELTPRERYKECYRLARMCKNYALPIDLLEYDVFLVAVLAQAHYEDRAKLYTGWVNPDRWNRWMFRHWDYKYLRAKELKYA